MDSGWVECSTLEILPERGSWSSWDASAAMLVDLWITSSGTRRQITMALVSEGSVVAGFDGSQSAQQAVGWAAREAASRRRPLLLVHALRWPLEDWMGLHAPPHMRVEQSLRKAAE